MAEEGEPEEKYKKFKLTTVNDELDGGTYSPIESKSLDIFYLLKYLATLLSVLLFFILFNSNLSILFSTKGSFRFTHGDHRVLGSLSFIRRSAQFEYNWSGVSKEMLVQRLTKESVW